MMKLMCRQSGGLGVWDGALRGVWKCARGGEGPWRRRRRRSRRWDVKEQHVVESTPESEKNEAFHAAGERLRSYQSVNVSGR